MVDLALLRQALEIGRLVSERPKTPEDPTSLAAVQAETFSQVLSLTFTFCYIITIMTLITIVSIVI